MGQDISEPETDEASRRLLELLEAHIRIDRLLEITSQPLPESRAENERRGNRRIAVARNSESFSFLYTEHLDLLKRYGEVFFFNPEESAPLPDGIDLLYLPGG